MDKLRKKSKKTIMITIASISMTLGISCEKNDMTRSLETYDYTIKPEDPAMSEDSVSIDDKSGFSFDLESDSLVEQIEDIQFQAQEWEESSMNADL